PPHACRPYASPRGPSSAAGRLGPGWPAVPPIGRPRNPKRIAPPRGSDDREPHARRSAHGACSTSASTRARNAALLRILATRPAKVGLGAGRPEAELVEEAPAPEDEGP